MIQALLCDIDGTLVDSNHLHAESWQRAFAYFGIQTTVEKVLRQIGKGSENLLPVFVPKDKLDHIRTPLEEYRKHLFQSEYLSRVKPFPRARDFLLRLRQEGIRLALASSASAEDLEVYKNIVGMTDLIEESTSADDAARSKPHPDIFESALQKLGLPADRCLALGDTPWDAEAARKCGLWTIGVTSGGWPEKDLIAAGCLKVYPAVANLLDDFENSPLIAPITPV